VPDELELPVARCFDPIAVNLNLESIASRFLDWGGRLCAAYGSFTSPAGVNGLVYDVGLLGLLSREAGTDESCVPGPIEKAPLWCLGGASVDSVERLVGAVWPDDPGRESSIFVVVGDVPGDEIWGVTAVGSSSVLTF
jgi:hypothetical protein